MTKHASLALPLTLLLGGCATLTPDLPPERAGVASEWPLVGEVAADAASAPVQALDWRAFFDDPALSQVVALALDNNRDLRIAIANVERARSQYRIQRADRLPSVGADVSLTRVGGDVPTSSEHSAGVGLARFELDLFGRVRNLSEAALQGYLATEQAQQAVRLSLIAEVANAWLTLAADQELVRIAAATLENYEASYQLSEKRYELGAISALDAAQLRTQVESARADLARLRGQVARDRNALDLLVGAVVDAPLLPDGFQPDRTGLPALPAGLPSETLLRRPQVIAAEHRLLAANANIGAARAAFFPSISLTGSAGSVSDEFSGLFDSGTNVWRFAPSINLPIFQGGRLRAALGMAEADRDIALAQYEQAIQIGFREVADALAHSRSLGEQRAALEALVDAATRSLELSQARYEAGKDSYLVLLDAQRTLFTARQALVATQLAEQTNRTLLYKALGGGWSAP